LGVNLFNEYEGDLNGTGLKIALVVARFNEIITSRLLKGAEHALLKHHVEQTDIDVVWVPGAFEIPLVAQQVALVGQFDAIICLGAVIKGQTPHFEYVSAQVSDGISTISLETRKPIMFGILTTNNMDQALERSGGISGNKGYESATGAIQMVNLLKKLNKTFKD